MVRIFGVRHHGPGSARALVAAFGAWRPDVVLVEGPPEADGLLPLVGAEGLVPPVALLVHAVSEPKRAVFYPLARFSPEWNAVLWANQNGVPVRFCDLPQGHQLVEQPAEDVDERDPPAPSAPPGDPRLRHDPLGWLSRAQGYDDDDGWWDAQIESRSSAEGVFEAVLELIRDLRAESLPPEGREARREAWMRRTIREAVREGHERVAVVVGAWHAPALEIEVSGQKKVDDECLRGMPKAKVSATWVPWTHKRLAMASGYGAGVASPAWYAHLWDHPDRAAVRWVSEAARLLRGEDLDASSASVIEAVRLADALAMLRARPAVGLGELREAVQTVLCRGETTPMSLVHERLVVGHTLGGVPISVPTLPLQLDLEARARSVRLKFSDARTSLEVDLREEGGRARSVFLHQLRALGVPWGTPAAVSGATGSFREGWTLLWDPEFAVRIVEASVWGGEVEAAAAARLVADTAESTGLPEVSALLQLALLAALTAAIDPILARIQSLSAGATDISFLAGALTPLAQVSRYGDVRGTTVESVLPVFDGLVERVFLAFPLACLGIDEPTARARTGSMRAVGDAVDVAARPGHREGWFAVLDGLAEAEVGHPRVRGFAARLCLDSGRAEMGAIRTLAARNLGSAVEPIEAAAWIEGLLEGGATRLLHEDSLWRVLDGWLASLPDDTFPNLLPALRRAFSSFSGPERAKMGQKLKTLGSPTAAGITTAPPGLDPRRTARLWPTLAAIVGVTP